HDDLTHAERDDGIGADGLAPARGQAQDDRRTTGQALVKERRHILGLMLLPHLELVLLAASVTHPERRHPRSPFSLWSPFGSIRQSMGAPLVAPCSSGDPGPSMETSASAFAHGRDPVLVPPVRGEEHLRRMDVLALQLHPGGGPGAAGGGHTGPESPGAAFD